MKLQAIIITTDNGKQQVFVGLPLIEDEEVTPGIEDMLFSNIFSAPEDANLQEAIAHIHAAFMDTEEVTEAEIIEFNLDDKDTLH